MLQTEQSEMDQLSTTLREAASRRRHGALLVHASPHGYEIHFQNGKIVFVQPTHTPFTKLLSDRLTQGGYLLVEAHQQELDRLQDLRPCFDYLIGECGIAAELVKQAVYTLQTDLLHSLRDAQIYGTEFRNSAVDVESAFTLSLSPGQLLLDLVEVGADLKLFDERFGGIDQPVIFRQELDQSVRAEARALWNELPVEIALADLVAASLRSEHEIKSLLLALYDGGAIAIADTTESPIANVKLTSENTEDAPPAISYDEIQQDEDLDLFAAEGYDLISEGVVEEPFGEDYPEFPDDLPAWDEKAGRPMDVAGEAGASWAPDKGIPFHRSLIRITSARFSDGNSLLREGAGLKVAGVLLTAAVMVALAMYLPTQLTALFEALARSSEPGLPWDALF